MSLLLFSIFLTQYLKHFYCHNKFKTHNQGAISVSTPSPHSYHI